MKTITQARFDQIMQSTDPDGLTAIKNNPNSTIDSLLCELYRIRQILSGECYFDYDSQKLVEKGE